VLTKVARLLATKHGNDATSVIVIGKKTHRSLENGDKASNENYGKLCSYEVRRTDLKL